MEFAIPEKEWKYLRGLAGKQAEYASLPVMEERKQMWYALNDAKPGAKPPVIIETGTFDRDFMPESIFQCESKLGQSVERQLLNNIRNHELINDDKVMPDSFNIGWWVAIDEFGVKIERSRAKDQEGYELGYKNKYPITDLKADFEKLKPAQCSVDKNRTMEWKAFLEELFKGVLAVEIRSGAG